MALTDEDTTVEQQRFCTSCGQPAGTGHFCANCGAPLETRMAAPGNSTLTSNSTGAGGAVPPPTFTTTKTAPPAKPQRNLRVLLIALGALGLVAVAVAVVILTTRGNGASTKHPKAAPPSAAAIYRSKLRAALSPLINSNQQTSSALGSVDPSNSNVVSAKNAASSTQTAVATARGAVGALNVPASERTLSQQVQQALDNESGYVQAVIATLGNPHSSQASQLQTLATSLQSSLVPLDPVVSGASSSVSGTSTLTSWANAASTRERKAAAKHHHASSSSGTASSSGSSSVSADPHANGEDCGNGVYAGPNTSCPFAENVYQAWLNSTGGDTVVVQAYSPVTNETYAMDCAPAGNGITCTGGNNASVSWSFG